MEGNTVTQHCHTRAIARDCRDEAVPPMQTPIQHNTTSLASFFFLPLTSVPYLAFFFDLVVTTFPHLLLEEVVTKRKIVP
jgi:hypothetical protein